MKKSKVSRIVQATYLSALEEGRRQGAEDERRKQTEYFRSKPGYLDMEPPPRHLYREIALPGNARDCRDFRMQTVRLRAVANVIEVKAADFPGEPQGVRFFTWELCR